MDVALVITGHAEGDWLRSSILSAETNAKLLLDRHGISSKIYVFLDGADIETKSVAYSLSDICDVFEVAFLDLGLVRNYAASTCEEKFVAFLDGDDIWGFNWIAEAIGLILHKSMPDLFVLHPEVNYCFGTKAIQGQVVVGQISSDDPQFDPYALVSGNYWSALVLAPRSVFQLVPYKPRSMELRTGYEDWSFNIETLEKRIPHFVVPKTVHFIRRKPEGSLGMEENVRKATFSPSKYWLGL